MAQQRNSTLDVLKLLASYMVVFIHITFYGKIGVAFDALARFAVPLFLVVSGFYSYEITPKQIKKRIIHILQLIVLSVTVYVFWSLLPFLLRQNTQGLAQYFSQLLSIKRWLKFFVFNVPFYTSHLWYLFAILYVYILYYLAAVFKIRKRVIWATAVLLLGLHLFLGEILSVFGIVVPIPLVRNFALMGIPLFGLGLLAKAYEHKLLHIPNYAIVICLIIGILETMLSRYFFGKNELYIGSLFILLAIVVIFIKFPNAEYPTVLLSLTNCSTFIYIFHPIVSAVIIKIYSIFGIVYGTYAALQMIHPLFVCAVSTFSAAVLNKIIKRLKENKQKYGREA